MNTFTSILAAGLIASAAQASDTKLVAHEWGTFTSFSGSDGVRIPVTISIGEDLPVWVRARREGRAWSNADDIMNIKISTVALERMETPVIYFYSDVPATVDVAVNFPTGLITEVFPPVTAYQPIEITSEHNRMVPAGGSSVRWSHVAVDAKTAAAPKGLLDAGASHYAAARQTDSSLVHLPAVDGSATEKFLFYRGVADCNLGVSAKALGGDRFVVLGGTGLRPASDGTGAQPSSPAVFVLERAGGHVRFARFDGAKAGAELLLPKVAGDEAKVAAEFADALTKAGLYEREAAAMVNTWKSLWFGEEGTRVMVILPQATIDSVLPLTITPTPDSVKRVFVARLEILTPEREEAIRSETRGGEDRGANASPAADALGRFKWPAIGYVREHSKATTK